MPNSECQKGFSPLIVIVLVLILGAGGFFALRMASSVDTTPTEKRSFDTDEYGLTRPDSTNTSYAPTDYKTLNCDQMRASFSVPANFVSYEEQNSRGEQVCIFSNDIREGQASKNNISILVFATQNATSKLGISSREAALNDTKKYGGMTDLPETVFKDGAFSTFHVIVTDAHDGTTTQYIDSISNDDTDTFYTIILTIPKTKQGTIDASYVMDNYLLGELH